MGGSCKRIFFLVACFLSISGGRAEPLVPYEAFTLKNGLQFILLQNKRAPIVSYTTWFKVGSADEIAGKTGIAHYLEHLMETALPEVQMGQFLEDFQSSGTHSNAFTSLDYTFYYKMTTTDKLELLMRYEAGRMRGVAFNQDKFRTERNVILEERLMRTENDPQELFKERYNQRFFGLHPYANPIIGWEKDIRALTLKDIKAFHKKWYQPSNAIVILSGDFDSSKVRAWAQKYYAPLLSEGSFNRERPLVPLPDKQARSVEMDHLRTTETALILSYALPNLKKTQYKDALALLLLSEYLNGDAEGGLQNLLVQSTKLATAFQTNYTFDDFLDGWPFVFHVSPTHDKNIPKIKSLIIDKLAQIGRDGLEEAQLSCLRTYVYNGLVMQLDDIFDRASFIGTCIASGVSLEQINRIPEDLQTVTSADIQGAIVRYLTPQAPLVGILKKTAASKNGSAS